MAHSNPALLQGTQTASTAPLKAVEVFDNKWFTVKRNGRFD